jgi:hypothetical protein
MQQGSETGARHSSFFVFYINFTLFLHNYCDGGINTSRNGAEKR